MELTTTQLILMDEWIKEAVEDPAEWKVDPILWHNQKILLAYKSKPDGPYVMLSSAAADRPHTLDIGIVKHALPNITDGIFKPDLTLTSSYSELQELYDGLIS